jgi:hypothetical protein
LGHYDEFPLNDSWRFFDADQSFIDPANPWINTIEDGVNIPNLSSNTIADFVGVKVGDVNESAMDGFTSGIDTRSGQLLSKQATMDRLLLLKTMIRLLRVYN